MMIYEFEIKNFNASDGYTRIEVKDGQLEFDALPDAATLTLIKKYDGKLAETQPPTARGTRAESRPQQQPARSKRLDAGKKDGGE